MKPSCPPEGNQSKNPTDGNMGQASNPKKYRGKKPQNKPTLEPEANTEFKGRCNDLEGYIFDLGRRLSNKFVQTIKD